jgi:PAS domain S-box-containing protein
MPVMDGFETASLIRQRPTSEHTPIIFVTSFNDSEKHITRGYSLGAVDYILSPIVPEVLRTKVSVFVDLYRKTDQVREQAERLLKVEEAEHNRRLTEAVDRLEVETKRNRFFTLAVDMLAIANFDGFMLQLNPAWKQTLGFSEDELKAKSGLEFAHPDDRAAMQKELLLLQQGAPTAYFEMRCRHKNGSYRWLGWTAAPFLSEKLIYIFARDITDRKESEEKINSLNLELQRRVAELTEMNIELEAFNYSISHDLRAPLRSMQGFARALLDDEDSKLGEDGKSYAKRIVSSGGYMDTLLQGLLNYSRLTHSGLEMMPVNLDEIMAEVMTISDKEIKDRNAQVEIQSPLKPVVANPTTMGQILANMVSNALKFVEPGKKPVVKIRTEQGASADRVRLIVEDNGIGIEQTHQKKIFGLFERLHNSSMYPGTGVGLAIVRKGTERMGGSVGLESAPGAGSRFWIELPAV